jgi:DNA polymerase (family X)
MDVQRRQRSMNNRDIARVFDDIANLLGVKQDSPFKIRAYRDAARIIASHPEEMSDIVARGGDLQVINGIGEAIAKKTVELVTTGRLEFFENLRESALAGVLDLMRIPGVGPKTAIRLTHELAISSMEDLDAVLKSGAVQKLPGFGEKAVRTLLAGIEEYRQSEATERSQRAP